MFITADFKLSLQVLLTEAKIQAKIPSHSGDCVLGDDQLDALPLMTKGLGIFSIA